MSNVVSSYFQEWYSLCLWNLAKIHFHFKQFKECYICFLAYLFVSEVDVGYLNISWYRAMFVVETRMVLVGFAPTDVLWHFEKSEILIVKYI